jgi:hypothetical protein
MDVTIEVDGVDHTFSQVEYAHKNDGGVSISFTVSSPDGEGEQHFDGAEIVATNSY